MDSTDYIICIAKWPYRLDYVYYWKWHMKDEFYKNQTAEIHYIYLYYIIIISKQRLLLLSLFPYVIPSWASKKRQFFMYCYKNEV